MITKRKSVVALMLGVLVIVVASAVTAQTRRPQDSPSLTTRTASVPNTILVDGVKYSTVQEAINALPTSGGTVIIRPGIYAGPTKIPSGTRLVGMGNIAPPQIWRYFNGANFNSFTAGSGSLNTVQFTYTSSLTISNVSQIVIDGIILDFGGSGGLTLQGVSQSDFEIAVVEASTGGPAVALAGSTSYSTSNNHFGWLITEGGNEGLQIGSSNYALRYPSENRFDFLFVMADTQPTGPFTALDFVANCDSNFVTKIETWATTAITNYRGIVFNSSSTTADNDADNEFVGWYDETLAGPPLTSTSIVINPESGAFFRTGVLNSNTKLAVTLWANVSTYSWERIGDNTGGSGFGSQMTTVGALLIDAGTPSLFLQKAGTNKWQIYDDSNDSLNFANEASATSEKILQGGGHSFVEQSARSGASGQDICYGDSTDHAMKCSYNNGSFGTVCLSNGCPGALATGTQSVAGCRLSSAIGGAWAGSFKSGTAGTCTVTITPGITAPHGWTCNAHDITTMADLINQTAYTTTTATISGSTANNDVIT